MIIGLANNAYDDNAKSKLFVPERPTSSPDSVEHDIRCIESISNPWSSKRPLAKSRGSRPAHAAPIEGPSALATPSVAQAATLPPGAQFSNGCAIRGVIAATAAPAYRWVGPEALWAGAPNVGARIGVEPERLCKPSIRDCGSTEPGRRLCCAKVKGDAPADKIASVPSNGECRSASLFPNDPPAHLVTAISFRA